jgi:AraC family transcriptional regulator of adaptative response/methylated-DNA-[protein]-cysteine methyltransferase
VLDAALDAGLSGPGRLHDLLISTDALTPGEIRKRGEGISIGYGFGESLFGKTLVAWSPRGISFLAFCEEQGPDRAVEGLRRQWSNAEFVENPERAREWVNTIFNQGRDKPIPVWLRGSAFQLKVWEALLQIPEGRHTTYGHIASLVGHPGAARAVGTAIGSNPIAYIIPCHRVIRQVGEIGGYRWGESTKRAIIGYEAVSASL